MVADGATARNLGGRRERHVDFGDAFGSISRRSTIRRRGFDVARSYGALTVGLAAILALGGCSDDPTSEPLADPEPAADTAPAETDASSAEDATSDEDRIVETWIAFHRAWTEQLEADEADPAAFEGLAEDPAHWAGLIDELAADDRFVTLEVEHWTTVDVDGAEASIGDCIIAHEHLAPQDPDDAEHRPTWWTATAVLDGDDWLIRSRNEDRSGPCVAEELNDQLLAAYEEYRRVKDDAWDPPDPDHPELDQVATGGHLEFLREILAEDAEAGMTFREPAPTDDAVVFDLAIGFAVVSDCTEQVAEFGVYDLETGERLDDEIAPVEDGQVDLQSVNLVLEDDIWKVEEQGVLLDSNCNVGGTDHVVR